MPASLRSNAYTAPTPVSPELLQALDQACSTKEHGPLESLDLANVKDPCDVFCVTGPDVLDRNVASRQLAAGGTLILTPESAETNLELDSGFNEPEYYSDTVAQRLHSSIPIYHYSERIEEEIGQQTATRQGAFTVFGKA